jgi:hypothetical protein
MANITADNPVADRRPPGRLIRFLDLVALCRSIAGEVEAGRNADALIRRLGVDRDN